jgi:hypothetical protein
MASFNDLPQDVLWLIFRKTIVCTLISEDSLFIHEENVYYIENPFVPHEYVVCTTNLSLINKKSLNLIRTKCFKEGKGWWFIKERSIDSEI